MSKEKQCPYIPACRCSSVDSGKCNDCTPRKVHEKSQDKWLAEIKKLMHDIRPKQRLQVMEGWCHGCGEADPNYPELCDNCEGAL